VKLEISVDGRTYVVEVEASEPEPTRPTLVAAHLRAPAAPAAPRARPEEPEVAPGAAVCRSPIAGTVVRVLAQPGQAMQVGDALLVLEAMKMETTITAPVAATVERVTAKAGEAVRGGQLLVEFRSPAA
jgi:biotin carboxyl carrier protein